MTNYNGIEKLRKKFKEIKAYIENGHGGQVADGHGACDVQDVGCHNHGDQEHDHHLVHTKLSGDRLLRGNMEEVSECST